MMSFRECYPEIVKNSPWLDTNCLCGALEAYASAMLEVSGLNPESVQMFV